MSLSIDGAETVGSEFSLPAPITPPLRWRLDNALARFSLKVPSSQTLGALIVIVGVIAVCLWQLHLPLLLTNTTTTGGDTGAHFILPAFASAHLLPHLTGWDPGWYDGFPLYTFYFVLPDSLVAILSHVIAYNLVFKWATVAGTLTLPVAAYLFGRLCNLRAPLPAAMSAATLPFLFDPTFTIDGGNIFSTLAGEYSYSLSLSLALLFLGLFVRYLRTGKGRTIAIVVLCATLLAHVVPTFYALLGAGLFGVEEFVASRRRVKYESGDSVLTRPRTVLVRVLVVCGGGLLLAAWWLVPFVAESAYSTSMNYSKVTTYAATLFPQADWWVLVLAAFAVMFGWWRRDHVVMVLSVLAALMAAALVLDPTTAVYNMRFLPLWFISLYLLAGWMVGVALSAWVRRRNEILEIATHAHTPGALSGALGALALTLLVVVPGVLPSLGGILADIGIHQGANQVANWASWNYTGFEGKASYKEFSSLMATMEKVGHTHGCGSALWEYNANQNRFGTPEALMDLPYFTKGCISSQEGLLFESAATTPFHFINQAELSLSPSEAVAGMPYGSLDVALGVQHLQLLGVRYYMAYSSAAVAQANADPTLTLVATSGPWPMNGYGTPSTITWDIYQVRHATVIEPLHNQPVVITGVGPSQATWIGSPGPDGQTADGPAMRWYLHPDEWNVFLAASGPSSWARQGGGARWPSTSRSEPKTTVSSTRVLTSSISFSVSRIGVPVLVKVSYFPAWKAEGALGPYRVAPNLMVVVPTSHHVVLHYGTTHAQLIGELLSVLALCALIGGWLTQKRRMRALR